MLDGIRYFVAFVFVITFPPVPVFWILGHRYIGLWRRLGARTSYSLLAVAALALEVMLYSQRDILLARQFGSNGWLMGAAAVFYAAAVWLEVLCRRGLKLRTLVGLPEFKPERPQQLLTEGVYARIRHPRYLVLILALIAAAAFSNYLAIYILVPVFVLQLWLVMVLEERELIDRFGVAYREYRYAVPRFLPRFSMRR